MAGYRVQFPTTKTDEQLQAVLWNFMQAEAFECVKYKGEMVYKKGMGIATGPQFIKIMRSGNIIFLDAWIEFAVMPGVYAEEMGLDGFVGAIPKRKLKSRVDKLIASLQ